MFTPKFPLTVAGKKWRRPLSHPEVEVLAKRADRLYRDINLSEEDRAVLLVRYRDLVKADKRIINLGRSLGVVSLRNDPGIRPLRPWHEGTAGESVKSAVGFVLRFAAWVERLERSYGLRAPDGRALSSTANGDATNDPGDDI